jgi:hypothetical protein
MFSIALDKARKFTMPVMMTHRFRNGRISSSLGTCVVVNNQGWALTAAHILADLLKPQESVPEIAKYEADKAAILARADIKDKEKSRMIQRLRVSDEWITDHGQMFGPNWAPNRYFVDILADVALVELIGFDAQIITEYPVFKDPTTEFRVGTSLCRLGYPFHSIKADFDPTTRKFNLDPSTFPIPQFPNDGILTRFAVKNATDGTRQAKFIETSTPGLRGQSGGPIFDKDGVIWAIQSQTISLPLGFSPSVKQGGREVVEHQFIHLGWGSHVQHAIELMRSNGVSFQMQT